MSKSKLVLINTFKLKAIARDIASTIKILEGVNDHALIFLGKELMDRKEWFLDELHNELGGKKKGAQLIRGESHVVTVLHELGVFYGHSGDSFIISYGEPSKKLMCLASGSSCLKRYNSYHYNLHTMEREVRRPEKAKSPVGVFIGVDFANGSDWTP
ncbi:hypothetical protein [Vibrio parahaemolyticus]|uniref:hypothetical protein n=1 Tax=Vibrio parahaemolyticus TaxID=670 RepID=UPI00084A3FEA|nr:hypothetical protein [Vibrio parahaemolyticus]ODY87397.1 hypothetical protein BBM31_04765 [Vibrio parahaemolyticus]